MDEVISAGTSSLHVAIKTIMSPLIKGLLPVNMQETCLQRGYKIFYGCTCPGVIKATSQRQSVQSGFRSFLFSFILARVSVRGQSMGLFVKKGARFQVTCMLLVSYLHFSLCSGAERSATLILFISCFSDFLLHIGCI